MSTMLAKMVLNSFVLPTKALHKQPHLSRWINLRLLAISAGLDYRRRAAQPYNQSPQYHRSLPRGICRTGPVNTGHAGLPSICQKSIAMA